MPNQVHGAFSSRHVRLRAFPRANRTLSTANIPGRSATSSTTELLVGAHGHLGNALFPAHRQVHIPTPPVRITPRRCLCCFHQQEAQQRIALLADVSQPLPTTTGVLTGNDSQIAADLLATGETLRCSDDQLEG